MGSGDSGDTPEETPVRWRHPSRRGGGSAVAFATASKFGVIGLIGVVGVIWCPVGGPVQQASAVGLRSQVSRPAGDETAVKASPAWWGGWAASLEQAFEAASTWAHTAEVDVLVQGRGWVTADGRWAVGAALLERENEAGVADAAADPEVRGSELDALELDALELDALEMVSRDRAIRALAVARLVDRDPVAIHGALGRGGQRLRSRTMPPPRTRSYAEADRVFSISVVESTSLRELVLDGVDLAKGANLGDRRPRGLVLLASETARPELAISCLVAAAKDERCDGETLLEAAELARKLDRDDLATGWTSTLLEQHPLDLDRRVIARVEALVEALDLDATLVRRLATCRSPRERLEAVVTSAIQEHPLPADRADVLIVEGETVWRIVFERVRDGDPAEQYEAARWRARLDPVEIERPQAIAEMTWSGVLRNLPSDRLVVPLSGGTGQDARDVTPTPVTHAVVVSNIVGTPAADASSSKAGRRVGPTIEIDDVRLEGAWDVRRHALVANAVFRWCVEACRLDLASRPGFAATLEGADLAVVAPWVVPGPRGGYEVHLDAAAAERVLAGIPSPRDSVTLSWTADSSGVPGIETSTIAAAGPRVQSAVAARLLELGIASTIANQIPGQTASEVATGTSDASASREDANADAGRGLRILLSLDSTRGEEPGRFGGTKPFTDVEVEIGVAAAGGEPFVSVRRSSRRVYGNHPIDAAASEAIEQATAELVSRLDREATRAVTEASPAAVPADVVLPASALESARAAARRCLSQDQTAPTFDWPGGEAGVRRFVETGQRLGALPAGEETRSRPGGGGAAGGSGS